MIKEVKTNMDENKKQLETQQPQSTSEQETLSSTQPSTITNKQSYQSAAQASNGEFKQLSDRKTSGWSYFFAVLIVLQFFGIGLFSLSIAWAVQQAKAGMAGTEFVGLLLSLMFIPAIGLISLINLIGLPIYIAKHKPRGSGPIFCVLSLIVSVLFIFYIIH